MARYGMDKNLGFLGALAVWHGCLAFENGVRIEYGIPWSCPLLWVLDLDGI